MAATTSTAVTPATTTPQKRTGHPDVASPETVVLDFGMARKKTLSSGLKSVSLLHCFLNLWHPPCIFPVPSALVSLND